MGKIRRSLSVASRSEARARGAAFEWLETSLKKLEPDGNPETMLQIATAFSKMSLAQMKVRQVKGKDEEDEKVVDDVAKNVEDLQEALSDPAK